MPPEKCENWILSEFPAEHAPEVVGVKLRPGDDPWQRMDEHVEAEIGRGAPERTQRLGVERLSLQLGGDDHAREAEIDYAALELGRRLDRLQCGNVSEADEAARMIVHRLAHAVVDQAAGREVGLVEAGAAGEHAGVDPGAIHHPHVGLEIREQRIEQVVRVAVRIELHRDGVAVALEQFGRRVVLLEINDHVVAPEMSSWRRQAGCSRAASSASHR